MDQTRICPSCGKPLGADVPMGFCPECLIQAGFPTGTETQSDPPTMFVPPPVEELARLFPQLEIIELAGKGGMGVVYKARQKQLNRLVALKILPPGVGSHPAFAERFTREAQALAQLNHPGIVTLYEFGDTCGQFYFLMEFVDGVTLRQLLQRGRVSAREALAIVPQLCDALQYAHDQGIVHRDIKPENIMLDRRGRVKVTDFGLAKLMVDESAPSAILRPGGSPVENPNEPGQRPVLRTGAGKVMGTPQYMAPEQADHPADVDHRADIYALGVVFYQMLTGELPGKKIEPPSKKVQVDVRLDEIVLRALEQKPELRYQQASVLKTELETVGAAASGSAKSGGEGGRQSAAAEFVRNREEESRWTVPGKQKEQFPWLKLGARVSVVVLVVCGVAAIILFATLMVLRHRALAAHPLKLAEDPWKLKTLPAVQVIKAGLTEPKVSWAWNELQERARSNKIGTNDATLLVTELIGWLRREHPNGYDQPLFQLGALLSQLNDQHLIAETNALVFLKARAGSPVCDALPRIHKGQSSVELVCHVHTVWDDRLLGFQMLNELGHITIDGQLASARDLWKVPKTSADQSRELNTIGLAPGLHIVRCEVESDFQKESDLAGLDRDAGSDEWPLSNHRWPRFFETPLMVYDKDAVIVGMTNDAAINPTNGARISVKTIIIRPAGKQLSAVAAFANPAPKPGVALSVAVTLRLPGQSIALGELTAFQNADGQTRMTGDGILKGNLDSLSPDIKEADIVLTPEPTAVESWPGVDRIWGKEIVLSHIPLTRQDLAR